MVWDFFFFLVYRNLVHLYIDICALFWFSPVYTVLSGVPRAPQWVLADSFINSSESVFSCLLIPPCCTPFPLVAVVCEAVSVS